MSLPAQIWTLFQVGGGSGTRAVPFTPDFHVATSGSCVVFASGAASRVWTLSDGSPVPVPVDLALAPGAAVTDEAMDDWVEALFDEMEVPAPARRDLGAVFLELPRPDRAPVFDALLIDDVGWVWIREFDSPLGRGTRWAVFDAAGASRGAVEFPSGFEPREIVGDFVWGVSTGPLGLESIARIPVGRSGGSIARCAA